jgi:hypothetical protein
MQTFSENQGTNQRLRNYAASVNSEVTNSCSRCNRMRAVARRLVTIRSDDDLLRAEYTLSGQNEAAPDRVQIAGQSDRTELGFGAIVRFPGRRVGTLLRG